MITTNDKPRRPTLGLFRKPDPAPADDAPRDHPAPAAEPLPRGAGGRA